MADEDQTKILAEIRDILRENLEQTKRIQSEHMASYHKALEQYEQNVTVYRKLIENYNRTHGVNQIRTICSTLFILFVFVMIVFLLFYAFSRPF